jgi:hydrogenase accessory protein HypB
VQFHWPLIDYQVGEDFIQWFWQADAGKLEPFVLVVEALPAGDRGASNRGALPGLQRTAHDCLDAVDAVPRLWNANTGDSARSRVAGDGSGGGSMNGTPRLLEIRQKVLKRNDVVARELRAQFRSAGVFVVSLVSSPGSGKTLFLEKTLASLRPRYRIAALVGDLATENDAARLARSGAPVRQIVTGTVCHLEAEMIRGALADWDLTQLDYLFIENVGNLVCPASYDLGEDARAVLMSFTEGEDKPLSRHGRVDRDAVR